MARILKQVAALVILSTIVAGVANAAREKSMPWIPDLDPRDPTKQDLVNVSLDQVREHINAMSATFIDARRPDQYTAGHLQGALNLPAEDPTAYMATIWNNVAQDTLLVIYCDGGRCEASHNIYDYLKANEFKNLRIFVEGWELIETTDLPVVTGEDPWGGAAFDPNDIDGDGVPDDSMPSDEDSYDSGEVDGSGN